MTRSASIGLIAAACVLLGCSERSLGPGTDPEDMGEVLDSTNMETTSTVDVVDAVNDTAAEDALTAAVCVIAGVEYEDKALHPDNPCQWCASHTDESEWTPVTNGTKCDDDDPDTQNDACVDGQCVGVNLCADVVCSPKDQCHTAGTCDAQNGTCSNPPVADNTPCDDGNACTLDDTCQAGACESSSPVDCTDDNECTSDLCDSITGCSNTPQTGTVCNDGDVCTISDECAAGQCVGTGALNCNDDDVCTDDSCDAISGCVNSHNTQDCDDNDACTTGDVCLDGSCTPGVGVDCDDDNPCTDDSCDVTSGCKYSHNTVDCDDENACTLGDACVDGACVFTAELSCDDGNPCTSNTCDSNTGCVTQNVAADCDDKNNCTAGETCQDGACSGGVAVICDDGVDCTDDSCDEPTGCVHVPNYSACNDNNVCTYDICDPEMGCKYKGNKVVNCSNSNPCTTNDYCDNLKCVDGQQKTCDDKNPCTDDSCDPDVGCVFTANTNDCDDNNVCTLDDQCADKQCLGATAKDCDDDNPCTDDICDEQQGCQYANNQSDCDDDNVCTQTDACQAGECVGTDPLLCNDGKICTDDLCDAINGCNFPNNTQSCTDGNKCTVGDACADGECVSGPKKTCEDGNPCTSGMCFSPTGKCWQLPNTEPCEDGDKCTVEDQCKDKTCVPGVALQCKDNNDCTKDTCDSAKGCQFSATNAGKFCNDDDPCTTMSKCMGGVCIMFQEKDCNDNNPCTDDSCDSDVGCINAINTDNSCEDGIACTTDVCTDKGECSSTIDSDKCLVKGTCYSKNKGPEGCWKCKPQMAQDGFSYDETASCDDGFACTTDQCAPEWGGCVGTPNKDGYELKSIADPYYDLGTVNDNSPYPHNTLLDPHLWDQNDMDTFKYEVVDKSGKTQPRATLYNIPTNSDYELCLYYQCKWGFTEKFYGLKSYSCSNGSTKATSSYNSNLKGCCSDSSSNSNEDVKLTNIDCDGTLSESGVAYVTVTKKDDNKSCDKYSLDYGDN